ncbi:MAG: Peptidase M23 family protein [Candidatus Gottesmanbacteria bacterium GW2011_GWB1_43_11]|uniref:Peptidase M23 family protein n=1 Tax=Candidatus Gottesmanbacteria bacterium GW2011_GWB1_43_11 TaxID=1618446 RepID=A0A0G1CHX2_9BACT|nr:MAG: Peptidase M23 family protein [Candidatus Gottesmanbacteria bacterium GW2011_GWA1_42_26]KKS85087.1 MAG: Peptidase M23 family protein [Candidatus Gottesmanbacteria bacterium GW2011_GWB1_43_11]OGG08703.1 MAG: hypothetical protein A2699_06200 [Candidatus Gottesmanbacteria bacterium RIFCSPHIGHO2_01_FULL_43_15]OGG28178.1 MAG: hypothetical protein A3A59_04105 [Candidatus Gottesmanbacteria bacterium RIFCSPLOWO2_01_FULL_42_10]HCM37061.1 hypothetical protein [Patescibacteria group bacterium]
MRTLKDTSWDFLQFLRAVSLYTRRRLREFWTWFEAKKDTIVSFLVTKRGTYQRPFLHTSFFMLVGVGMVGLPIIANNYPSVSAEQLNNFTPPSAVLSSFDDQGTLTQVSEKPRDSVIAYKIEKGDVLSKIAEKFGVSIDSIKWLNPQLTDDDLTVGDSLQIPPVSGVVIKVQKGETIYSIAKKYKTDAQKILNWPFNDFVDLDTFALMAGQSLVVPDGIMPEAQPQYSPQAIAQVGKIVGNGQFIWPTVGIITQYPVSYHMALDIANSGLPAINAADGGKVVLVEFGRYGYGHHVIIDHGNGYQSLYGHMSDIYVKVGQAISKGQTIGKMGSTGRSSGPHLHFEIRQSGVLLNPLNFLK